MLVKITFLTVSYNIYLHLPALHVLVYEWKDVYLLTIYNHQISQRKTLQIASQTGQSNLNMKAKQARHRQMNAKCNSHCDGIIKPVTRWGCQTGIRRHGNANGQFGTAAKPRRRMQWLYDTTQRITMPHWVLLSPTLSSQFVRNGSDQRNGLN